uniref:Zinc finger PHD-type domain-containing protein n=1 Tax=Amphimedon queenslandica TaxID=400682 RepID=A0A1X7SWF2_AMPQE
MDKILIKVILDTASDFDESSGGYCWCGGKDIGKIIVCDNVLCETEWFHYECLGISCAPKGAVLDVPLDLPRVPIEG